MRRNYTELSPTSIAHQHLLCVLGSWRAANPKRLVKVARVNFAQQIFFEPRISYEKCSEIFPEIFEPLFCGSEKIPGKFSLNFPLNFPNFPAEDQKKAPTSFCRSAGRTTCCATWVPKIHMTINSRNAYKIMENQQDNNRPHHRDWPQICQK